MNMYGPKARKVIEKTMGEFKSGKLKSGTTNQPVKSRNQALAIGISKARKKHYKVPPENNSK